MAILKFEPNTPEQVQLKFASGKQHGNSMMYSLTDGRVMFLPQFADKQILALQARAGDRFQITKNITDGKVRWNIQRITETKPAPKPMAQANGATTNGVSSNGNGQPAAALLNGAPNLDGPDVESHAERNLEQALRISLMAAKKAEEYGLSIGKPVQFDTADIRLMANTMLINGRGRAA